MPSGLRLEGCISHFYKTEIKFTELWSFKWLRSAGDNKMRRLRFMDFVPLFSVDACYSLLESVAYPGKRVQFQRKISFRTKSTEYVVSYWVNIASGSSNVIPNSCSPSECCECCKHVSVKWNSIGAINVHWFCSKNMRMKFVYIESTLTFAAHQEISNDLNRAERQKQKQKTQSEKSWSEIPKSY